MDALKTFCAFIMVFCCANVRSIRLDVKGGIWSSTLEENIGEKNMITELYVTDADMGGRVNASLLPFPNLENLYLENSLRDMDPTFLKHMKELTYIGLAGNHLTRLNTDWFEGLEVKDLNMSSNWIVHLDAKLENLPELIELDLSGNRIIYLPSECFKNTPKLEWLYLQRNRLANAFPGTFKYIRRLAMLNLGGNRLDESLDPDAFAGAPIVSIDLSANRFKTLPCGLFRHLDVYELFLSRNNVGSFPFGCIHNMTKLLLLDLAATGLSELPVDAFLSLNRIVELFLGFNNLTRVDTALFANMPYLDHLDLSHNHLTSLEWNRGVRRLSTLNLSYNRFEILTHDFWYNAEELILSHNAIRRIEVRVGTHMPDKIYLDNNCIVQLNTSLILALKPKQQISVIENPWDCECYKDFVTVYRNQDRTRTLGTKSTRPYCAAVNVDKCIVTEAIEKEVYDSFRQVQPYPFGKCEP